MVGYRVKLTYTLIFLDLPHLRLWLDVSSLTFSLILLRHIVKKGRMCF
jgi:hypothetical protein